MPGATPHVSYAVGRGNNPAGKPAAVVPEMMVSLESGSTCTLNVGSSFWKRFSACKRRNSPSYHVHLLPQQSDGTNAYTRQLRQV